MSTSQSSKEVGICHCGEPAQGPPSDYPDVCNQWPLCENRPPRSPLNVEERVRKIESAEWSLAYDGCHKIYFLPSDAHERLAREYGYEIYPAPQLRQLIDDSCALVFVSKWGLGVDGWGHEWDIDQFELEEAGLR
jgi:hypothetical protein